MKDPNLTHSTLARVRQDRAYAIWVDQTLQSAKSVIPPSVDAKPMVTTLKVNALIMEFLR
jgi:hypothetical protein